MPAPDPDALDVAALRALLEGTARDLDAGTGGLSRDVVDLVCADPAAARPVVRQFATGEPLARRRIGLWALGCLARDPDRPVRDPATLPGMTAQIPDQARWEQRWYAITAVDGVGLFDPAAHGLAPTMLSTAAWRGFVCRYVVQGDRLLLDTVEMGRPAGGTAAGALFGVEPARGSAARCCTSRSPGAGTPARPVTATGEVRGFSRWAGAGA